MTSAPTENGKKVLTMAEYIDRDAALREIERREARMVGDKRVSVAAMKSFIKNRPAADVAPVVYCRECKRSGLTEFGKRYCSEPMGAFEGCIPVEDDSFCSGGKKREDAHAQD